MRLAMIFVVLAVGIVAVAAPLRMVCARPARRDQ